MKRKLFFSACVVILFTTIANAQTLYEKKTAKLMTVWGENLQAADPVLPEYPRPQMVRAKWLNLNGIWQFQSSANATEAPPVGNLSCEILVPFPVESALSGIMEHYDNVWYRRSFTIPADWAGERVLLHFGAVDYACEVFVNGASVGKHEGGYDPFTFDITERISGAGAQELTVRVNDQTDAKGYPRGKQTLYPGGIMYTSTTGIWQTVWLEAVSQLAYISRIRMVSDIDDATLKFYAEGDALTGKNLRFKIYDNGTIIADIKEDYHSDYYTLHIPKPLKLWSPDNPFLYDMTVYLLDSGNVIDSISTYFGMRKISKQLINGYYKMMLNNEFVFQMGPLDQGFWPDGIYTAPGDEALRFDIEKIKEFGFNMIRKHIKVEPQRWYYWCDKLGMLVWQDMPSMNSYINTNLRPVPPREEAAFKRELEALIKEHWNSPSIVNWVLFNENQGAHQGATLIPQMKIWDDSRLVNGGSGGPDLDVSDIRDRHNYPAPVYPAIRLTQALVCGEYGGIGYYEQGHIWQTGNPYETVTSRAKLLEKYTQYAEMLIDFKSNNGLSAAVYTEITDVEMELNGLMTYDRKVIKGNAADFYDVNQRIINETRYYTTVLPTSETTRQTWRYTLTQPANNWMNVGFDDSAWKADIGGFGTANTPGAVIGTIWNTSNIWLRRKFTLPENALDAGKTLALRIHHDEDCNVYINGVLAVSLTGYTSTYSYYDVSPLAAAALVLGGENTLAVYCKQTTGGQYIDVGVSTMKSSKVTASEKVKKNEEIRVCPNPVRDELIIANDVPLTNLQFTILDLSGKQIVNGKISDSKSINVSSLPSGTYLLKLKTSSYHDALTFIKE